MSFDYLKLPFEPLANPAAVVTVPGVRFTVLTDRLIRMEYCAQNNLTDGQVNIFEDHPSQVFWYRNQPVPNLSLRCTDNTIEIETDYLLLKYLNSSQGFTRSSLTILEKTLGNLWHYGDDPVSGGNLGGTYRTLDQVSAFVMPEPGLNGRNGWAVVDDSQTLVFDENGWLKTREKIENQDLYFFGFGHDYSACLKDYCKIAGEVPLIPRWVLGNWWSRYWEYSADELLGVMQEFEEHHVPLSVCIVDMDWHITNTGNASAGWTGYTWNRDLFPDPEQFIGKLHQKGLKTGLNLHPALGIWPHEEQYNQFAMRMQIDPETQVQIPFDCTNHDFMSAYFDLLHHPQEAIGVDFWWMDWQQGTKTKLTGLDPLWWLNHHHFYDLSRDGSRRSFVFSRWGGLGNHRYPIGFSGDTIINWDVLSFLPIFTSVAANVQFGWWSHDIGGHFSGVENDELYARWVQYGLFSPILRLHCTKNPYHERRPWKRGAAADRASTEAMRLRHAFIPYLYTMAWRNHVESLPLITPMYYSHPEHAQAYECYQQYWFGSELIAAPFTTPMDADTGLSRQNIWLPDGHWFNFFSGEYFEGGTWYSIYGDLDEIPVFARAGAIVPLSTNQEMGGFGNPNGFLVHIFPGSNNTFTLYEDDGVSEGYRNKINTFTYHSLDWESDHLVFRINPVEGDKSVIPQSRDYQFEFHSLEEPDRVIVSINGKKINPVWTYQIGESTLLLRGISLEENESLQVVIFARSILDNFAEQKKKLSKYISHFKLESMVKAKIDQEWEQIKLGLIPLDSYKGLTDAQINVLKSLIIT